jgi:hypothetical protein
VVKPNAALAISMDARDPLTHIAREVEQKVPFFTGRVDEQRRQLKRSSTEIVTITALRGACVTLTEGIQGVKHGAKPVPVPDATRLERIRRLSLEWFRAVTDAIGPAMNDHDHKLAGAPSVLAAIGAIGNDLLQIDDPTARAAKMGQLVENLRTVDWQRGTHWDGIAGKWTTKGILSIGGSKEYAYLVYDALHDTQSPAYKKVRHLDTSLAAA